jgi:hypothetical protein
MKSKTSFTFFPVLFILKQYYAELDDITFNRSYGGINASANYAI